MDITNDEDGESITNLVNVEGSNSNIESQGKINIDNKATGVKNIITNNGTIAAKELIKTNTNHGEQDYDINNSGTITADSIDLSNHNRSDGKNQSASIFQTKRKSSITAGSIKITGNYTEAIKQESGTIQSSSTIITTTLRNNDPKSASATGISISNGMYTNQSLTRITALDENNNINKDFVGITLKEKSTFNNEGTIIVNPTADPLTPSLQIGQNIAVKTQLQPSKAATFDNGSTGKVITKEGVDTIVHGSEGDLTVNNKGELESQNSGNTITAGSVLKNSGNGILTINNKGLIRGNITNEEEGKITINNTDFNNTNFGNIAGGYIINKKGGNIKITNESIFGSEIRNEKSGAVTLTNNNMSSGEIENLGTGSIEILNQGQRYGNITNYGDKIPDKNNITIKNNNILMGNIVNYGKGTIKIINNGNILNMSNHIKNTSSGDINLINNNNILGDLFNEDSGDFNFKNTGKYDGQIQNNGTKSFYIDNQNEMRVQIDNSNEGEINIENTGTINIPGTINNRKAGTINIKIINSGSGVNGGQNGGQIDNFAAGQVNLDNNGTLSNILIINRDDSPTTNNNDERINITNHNEIVNSPITNKGLGAIRINNLGKIDANSAITNDGDNKDALINIINEQSLLAPISNNKTGRIEFNNKEAGTFENSSLTNNGSGQINATNAGIFNAISISSNGANGNIDFTNTGTFTGTTKINPDAYNNSKGILGLKNLGIWTNTGNSTLSELTNTGTIKFPKISEAVANDKNQYHKIIVDGDYTGGGNIVVNTIWNKDENAPNFTDQLIITGNVKGGITTVRTNNGIYGNINKPEENKVYSIPVIHVDGTIDTVSGFEGSAEVLNGAGKAELKKIESKDGGTNFAWTLFAELKPDPVKPAPIDPIEPPPIDPIEPAPTEPVKPINPVPPKRVPIYAEPVSGYVQMPTVDMELGFTTIGTLHERRSENQTNNINSANNTAFSDTQQQTWGRVVVEHLDKNGKKRLDTGGSQSVLQIGHDFILDNNAKTGARRHIGGYVSYGHNENDFRDQYRAENGYIVDDHYTGKGRTDAVSIGGYGTFYGNNGGYVDLVSQVTYLRNKYNARSNESVHQNGWGAALSAEAGKSFIVYGNNWFVEPQAQLVYQYLSLDDFNDRYRHIDQHNPSALRGRMGMRFGYNGDTTDNLPPSSFYGIANIWHDFVNPKSVDIGRDTLKEEYAKTWGEIGAGIQWSITRQSDFYGDVRYEKNFGSDKRKGFKGTLGYKYTWL
ncbi:MAG: autotransporter outer membrane beta-barrel domain-containing protein [Snodgrassella sp.]|nr:autotransporter outer membrane beta-barrel domain-containing protein [Snodgrassella sp.]